MTQPLFVIDDALGLHASATHSPLLQVTPRSTPYFTAALFALEPCGTHSRVEATAKTYDDDDGLPGRLVDTSRGHDNDTGSMTVLETQHPSPPLD
jgi:hypothetical protein